MKMLAICVVFLLAGCASDHSGVAPNPPAKLKVLVVTGGHGFMSGPFFKMFQDNPAIEFTSAVQHKTADVYDRDDLLSYDVVVLYDAPQAITDAQKARLLSIFDKGTGVIVLHHA